MNKALFQSGVSLLTARWHELSAREQKLLSTGGAFVALCLLWFVGIDPALTTISRVKNGMSQAIEQAAKAQQLSADIAQLKTIRTGSKPVQGSIKAFVTAQLVQQRWTDKANVSEGADGLLTITLKDIPAIEGLGWIDQIEKLAELKSISITKTQAGLMNMTVELQSKFSAPGSAGT